MDNIIIGIILLGIVILAVRGSVKHFRGESSCCGGGSASVRPPKKRLSGKVIITYTLSIDGMHCQNCANNIERAINEIDGAAAKVNLRRHKARVCCDREIDIERIKAAVEEKGYKITSSIGNSAGVHSDSGIHSGLAHQHCAVEHEEKAKSHNNN